MRIKKLIIGTSLILLGLSNAGKASEVMNVDGIVDEVQIDLDLLEDKTNELSFEDVQLSEFPTNAKGQLNIAFSHSSFWGRFRLQNTGNNSKTMYLAVMPYGIDSLDLYSKDNTGEYKRTQVGLQIPNASEKSNHYQPTIRFEVPPGTHTFYTRIASGGDARPTLTIFDESSFLSLIQNIDLILGLLLGVLFLMIAYNSMLWITFKTKAYGYYIGYLASFLLGTLVSGGIAASFLHPNSTGGAFASQGLHLGECGVMIFSCLFTIEFLQMKIYHPKLAKGLLWSVWGIALCAVVMPILEISWLNLVIYQFVGIPFMIYAGIKSAMGGYRPAKFYLVSWGFFSVGAAVWIAAKLGIIDFTFYTSFVPGYGSTLECLFLAVALGDQVRIRQKEAAREIRSLNSELQEKIVEISEKEKARTLFFNNTSHELRTPLNGILGFVDLILRGAEGTYSPQIGNRMEQVKLLAEDLRDQVNTILEIARSNRGEADSIISAVPLRKILTQMESLAFGLRTDSSDVNFRVSSNWTVEDQATFHSDQKKLHSIMRNLVGNAFKFSKENSVNEIELDLQLSDKSLTITCSDTGIGISPENLNIIFDDFTQAEMEGNRKYEGSGLGLAMVKRYAEQMGGSIKVDSKLGSGTTFIVLLPEMSETQKPIASIPVLQQSLEHNFSDLKRGNVTPGHETQFNKVASEKTRKEKILVVDDNKTNVDVIASLMLSEGYQVDTAFGGEEALKKFDKSDYDLVLLDMMMPEMSGEEVLKAIRLTPKGNATPVIFLTAKASKEDRLAGLSLSADDYLAKPINSTEVLEVVKNNLDRIANAKEVGRLAQLIESDKIISLGTMASGIAHEINNPLTIIRGYISIIDSSLKNSHSHDANISSHIVKINETISRITRIIKGLATLSRDGKQDEFELTSIQEILLNTMSLSSARKNNQGVDLEIPENPSNLIVECRETQIIQILINLINNGCDATKDLENRWLKIDFVENKESIDILVTDSGAGIPIEIQRRIFDPFFTKKEVGEGTGLGLSISRSLAESHGGKLFINNEHKNTQFVLQLPKSQGKDRVLEAAS